MAANHVAQAILLKGPRDSDALWKARDTWAATGTMTATPEDIRRWGLQAQDIADQERRRVAKARGDAFVKWTEEAWSSKAGEIFE
eukprot:8000047-Heterocapsa_arctica.AAC.1